MLRKMRWRMMMVRMRMSRERKMMLMLRRRKMMMLRKMMWRRKTDPKTGKHTLYEPTQATCAWTFHKSHSVWKFTGKMAADTSGDIVLCEPAQLKYTWTCHGGILCGN